MRDPLEHGSNRASGSRTVRRFKSKWTYPGKNVCARQSLETFFFWTHEDRRSGGNLNQDPVQISGNQAVRPMPLSGAKLA